MSSTNNNNNNNETDRNLLLRDVFIRCDTDGDGLISAEDTLNFIFSIYNNVNNQNGNSNDDDESSSSALSLPSQQIFKQQNLQQLLPTFISLADTDNDNKLDLFDFLEAHSFDGKTPGIVPIDCIRHVALNQIKNVLSDSEIEELQIAFRVYDFDEDGYLNEEELASLLCSEYALCFSRDIDVPMKISRIVAQTALLVSSNKMSKENKKNLHISNKNQSLSLSEFIRLTQETNILPPSIISPLTMKLYDKLTATSCDDHFDSIMLELENFDIQTNQEKRKEQKTVAKCNIAALLRKCQIDAMISDTIATALTHEVELLSETVPIHKYKKIPTTNNSSSLNEILTRGNALNEQNEDDDDDESDVNKQQNVLLASGFFAASTVGLGSSTSAVLFSQAVSATGKWMSVLQICRYIFDALDSRKRNSLSFSDVSFLLLSRHQQHNTEQEQEQYIAKTFSGMDKDCDGELNFCEFLAALSETDEIDFESLNVASSPQTKNNNDNEDEDTIFNKASSDIDNNNNKIPSLISPSGISACETFLTFLTHIEARALSRAMLHPQSSFNVPASPSTTTSSSSSNNNVNNVDPIKFSKALQTAIVSPHTRDMLLMIATNGLVQFSHEQQCFVTYDGLDGYRLNEKSQSLKQRQIFAIQSFQQLLKQDKTTMMQLCCIMTEKALSIRNILAAESDSNSSSSSSTSPSIPKSIVEDAYQILCSLNEKEEEEDEKSGNSNDQPTRKTIVSLVSKNFSCNNRFDLRLTKRVASSLFNLFDTNRDEMLSKEEFIRSTSSGPFVLFTYSDLVSLINKYNPNSSSSSSSNINIINIMNMNNNNSTTTNKEQEQKHDNKNKNDDAIFSFSPPVTNGANDSLTVHPLSQQQRQLTPIGANLNSSTTTYSTKGNTPDLPRGRSSSQIQRNAILLSQSDLGYIQHLFHSLDTKHDNVIDLEELITTTNDASTRTLLGDPKGNRSREEHVEAAKKFLEQGDLDRDGVLSENEFISCFARGITKISSRIKSPHRPPVSSSAGGLGFNHHHAIVSSPNDNIPTTVYGGSDVNKNNENKEREEKEKKKKQTHDDDNNNNNNEDASSTTSSGRHSSPFCASSPESIEQLRYLFSYIDRNQNGLISEDELELLLKEFLETHFENDTKRLHRFTEEMMAEINNASSSSSSSSHDTTENKQEDNKEKEEQKENNNNNNNSSLSSKAFTFEQFVAAFERNPDLIRAALDAQSVRIQRTQDELEKLLREEDLRRIARVFVSLDTDGDGKLDFSELHDELFALIKRQYSSWNVVDIERTVRSIFDAADVTKEGAIDFSNFISAFVNKHDYHDITPENSVNEVTTFTSAEQQQQQQQNNDLDVDGTGDIIANTETTNVEQQQTNPSDNIIDSRAAQLRRNCTAEEISELKSLFNVMDANTDGKISAQELESLISSGLKNTNRDDPATISAIVDSVFAISDTNQDGFIDLREFIAAYETDSRLLDIPIMAAAARREAADRKMQEMLCAHDLRDIAKVFLLLDKNGDGALQLDELREAIEAQLHRLHPDMQAEKIDEAVQLVFSAADEQHEGEISLNSFIESFVQGHYLLPPSAVRELAATFSRPLSSEEKDQLVRLFNRIDKNYGDGDGTVSKQELERALTEVVGRETAQVISSVILAVSDDNGDGVIQITEFLRFYQIDNGLLRVPLTGMSITTVSSIAERLIPKQGLRRLGRMFHNIDTNQDKVIDAEELAAALELFRCTGNAISREAILDVARAKIMSAAFENPKCLTLDEFIASYATAGINEAAALLVPWDVVNDRCASPHHHRDSSLSADTSSKTSPRTSVDQTNTNFNASDAPTTVLTPTPPENNTNEQQQQKRYQRPSQQQQQQQQQQKKKKITTQGFVVDETEIEELKTLFTKHDINNNGFLDRFEFERAFKKLENFGLPISQRQIDMVFGPVARDGKLDFDGFCVVMLSRMRL